MIPLYIIIHCSATPDGKVLDSKSIIRYHKEVLGWSDGGYHSYVELVGNNYEVLKGRDLDITGAHCRDNHMNHKSLGLCVVGNFDFIYPPLRQWKLAVQTTVTWCDMFDIPVPNVKAHRDYNENKTCPGRLFDMGMFRTHVKEYFA